MSKEKGLSLAVLRWNTRNWRSAEPLTKEEKLELVIDYGFKFTKEEINNNEWKPNY